MNLYPKFNGLRDHFFCCHLLTFLKKYLGTLSMCQVVWIQIKANILLVLDWAKTACKVYY